MSELQAPVSLPTYRRDKSQTTKLASQLKDLQFDRVTLLAEDKEYSISRSLLALNSSWFRGRFEQGHYLKQNQEVLMQNTSPEHLETLLTFFETDFITYPTTTRSLLEFIHTVKELGVEEIFNNILQWLCKKVNASSAVFVIELGWKMKEGKLIEAAMEVINRHFSEEKLNKQLMEEATLQSMAKILNSDDLEVSSERELFEFTCQWLRKRNFLACTPGTHELLSCIRYVHLEFSFCAFEARKCGLLDERIDSLLMDANTLTMAPFGSVAEPSMSRSRCRKGYSVRDGILAVDYDTDSENGAVRRIQFFDTISKKWQVITELPVGIEISFVTVFQEQIAVIPTQLPGTLYLYNLNTSQWNEIPFELPDGLKLEKPTVVVSGDGRGLVIAGGLEENNTAVFMANLIGPKFCVTKLLDLPELVYVPRLAVVEGKTFIYGGYSVLSDPPRLEINTSMWVMSANTLRLQELSSVPKEAIALSAPRVAGGCLYTLIQKEGEVWKFDSREEKWLLLKNVPMTDFNHNVSFTVHDNCLFFQGTVQHEVESFYSLDLKTGYRQEYNCCVGAGKKYLKSVRLHMSRQ